MTPSIQEPTCFHRKIGRSTRSKRQSHRTSKRSIRQGCESTVARISMVHRATTTRSMLRRVRSHQPISQPPWRMRRIHWLQRRRCTLPHRQSWRPCLPCICRPRPRRTCTVWDHRPILRITMTVLANRVRIPSRRIRNQRRIRIIRIRRITPEGTARLRMAYHPVPLPVLRRQQRRRRPSHLPQPDGRSAARCPERQTDRVCGPLPLPLLLLRQHGPMPRRRHRG